MSVLGKWLCKRGWHKLRLAEQFINRSPIAYHFQGGYERYLGMQCQRCGHREIAIGRGFSIPIPSRPGRPDPLLEAAEKWCATP